MAVICTSRDQILSNEITCESAAAMLTCTNLCRTTVFLSNFSDVRPIYRMPRARDFVKYTH